MKIIRFCTFITALTMLVCNAWADTVTKSVSLTPGIARVYLNGSNELLLTQGDSEYVKVTAAPELISKVEVRVKDNCLYLGKEENWDGDGWRKFAMEPVRFEVQLRNIESIRLLGSGPVNLGALEAGRLKIIQYGSSRLIAKLIKAEAVILEMAGSGDFQGDGIETSRLEMRIVGSGKLEMEKLDADAGSVEIAIAGSGKVKMANLDAKSVEINISGSGDMTLDKLNAEQLEIGVSGSADIVAAGRITSQEVEINGSGNYRAADLVSETSDIELRGGSDVEINVRQKLTAEISRGGELTYYAGPDLVIDINGQGKHRNAGSRGN